jgi:hypothetical protein
VDVLVVLRGDAHPDTATARANLAALEKEMMGAKTGNISQ